MGILLAKEKGDVVCGKRNNLINFDT